jgi:hypothetical protein
MGPPDAPAYTPLFSEQHHTAPKTNKKIVPHCGAFVYPLPSPPKIVADCCSALCYIGFVTRKTGCGHAQGRQPRMQIARTLTPMGQLRWCLPQNSPIPDGKPEPGRLPRSESAAATKNMQEVVSWHLLTARPFSTKLSANAGDVCHSDHAGSRPRSGTTERGACRPAGVSGMTGLL